MVGGDLESNCGIVLVPGGVYREDFDGGVTCGVGELLQVVVDDVEDRSARVGVMGDQGEKRVAMVGELWKWLKLMWAAYRLQGGFLG